MDNIVAFNLAHKLMRETETEIRERTGLKIMLRMTPEEMDEMRPEEIAARIADVLGYDMDDIRSKSRIPHLVDARVIISVLLRNNLDRKMNMAEIGSIINVDHSSVVHYIRKAQDMMDTQDTYFLKMYNRALRAFEMKNT